MKRVQLFEFEDFSWFPSWLRSSMTNLIVVLQKMMGTNHVIASHVSKILKDNNISSIVDLGSGSGGIMPNVLEILRDKKELKNCTLTMTDLYPNMSVVKRFNKANKGVVYSAKSVNATNFNSVPEGLKTMINCFHHMPPESAKKILKSAFENKQPLFIYELTENKMPLLLWWIMLPISLLILVIMTFFMTPFVRPLTWQQIVFTYLIPIIPIFYAWDGQASLPRMYAFKDIEELVNGLSSSEYEWEWGYLKDDKGKNKGTYILGNTINNSIPIK